MEELFRACCAYGLRRKQQESNMGFGFYETGKEWNDTSEKARAGTVSETAENLQETVEDFEDCALEKVKEESESDEGELRENVDDFSDCGKEMPEKEFQETGEVSKEAEEMSGGIKKSDSKARSLRELSSDSWEHRNELAVLKEERQEAEKVMKEKFDRTISCEKGTDAYYTSLREYNEARINRESLEQKEQEALRRQLEMERRVSDMRSEQIRAGEEGIYAAKETFPQVDEIQNRYEEAFYREQPDKEELSSIQRENTELIGRLCEEKEALRLGMEGEMDQMYVRIRESNRERYDTALDPEHQRLAARYREMEDMYRKVDYSIVRLDENNISISEVTGKQYDSVRRKSLEKPLGHLENCAYRQGDNIYGYEGTCGPTSVANSLNRVTESRRYTENEAVTVAVEKNLCVKSGQLELAGGTGTKEVVRLIDEVKEPGEDIAAEVYEYENAPKVEELAEKVSASDTVAIVGVDSAILWDERGDVSCSGLFQSSGYSDHWIMVDSPVYTGGGLEGFRIADSGGGVDYVDKKKFEKMYLGDENYKVEDPTVILVRNRKER